MDLKTLTFLIVGATFAVYIGIAFWARARNTNEFYIAGGDIHPVANGMATAADWMSAASFISMAGLIAFFWLWRLGILDGLDGGLCIVGAVACSLSKKAWLIHGS